MEPRITRFARKKGTECQELRSRIYDKRGFLKKAPFDTAKTFKKTSILYKQKRRNKPSFLIFYDI